MSVAELQRDVSAAEFVYWQAFLTIEAEDIERRASRGRKESEDD